MPGFLLHVGAPVLCAHAGIATPNAPSQQVTVAGQPIVTMTCPYSVAGCTFPAMTSGAPPCVSAQWVVAAQQVFSGGSPVLLLDSQSICTPTGTPLVVTGSQMLVSGV